MTTLRATRAVLILCFGAALTLAGCASKVPVLDYDALDEQASPEVIQVWETHREVLVRVIQDKKFTLREFQASLRFFEKATDLPAHQDSTRYGRMPNERLTEDLRAWDDWFRANGARLRGGN